MPRAKRTGNKQPADDPALEKAVDKAVEQAEDDASTGDLANKPQSDDPQDSHFHDIRPE